MSADITYHIASTFGERRHVEPGDAKGNYATYEQAKAEYCEDFDGDSAILAKINDRWFRVSEFYENEVRYCPLDGNLLVGWHNLDEVLAGVRLNQIPFKDMLAMAALTSYCNGSLAKELGVNREALREYQFWERFAEYFGKPMYEFKV